MNTVEHLTAARDHLLEVGWVQRRYFDISAPTLYWPPEALEARCCARGALAAALAKDRKVRDGLSINNAIEDSYAAPAVAALAVVIGERFIGVWNDAPERTFDEVIAAFDAAIASAS